MNHEAWMTLWTALLVGSVASFAVMLLVVGAGAWGELRDALADLREDTRAAAEHPEDLDREI